MIRICMTSDFFEEADPWRGEAWGPYQVAPRCEGIPAYKVSQRIAAYLLWDWDEGWENMMFNIAYENQQRADERIPILLELSFKHKGIMWCHLLGQYR